MDKPLAPPATFLPPYNPHPCEIERRAWLGEGRRWDKCHSCLRTHFIPGPLGFPETQGG